MFSEEWLEIICVNKHLDCVWTGRLYFRNGEDSWEPLVLSGYDFLDFLTFGFRDGEDGWE